MKFGLSTSFLPWKAQSKTSVKEADAATGPEQVFSSKSDRTMKAVQSNDSHSQRHVKKEGRIEEIYDHVPGVTKTVVGYTGGSSRYPTYKSVCSGDGHTEAIRIWYDTSKVQYEDLLKIFYRNCSAVSKGKKTQYKSAIWYHTEEQREIAEDAARKRGKERVLDIKPVQPWYDAEGYHQKYYKGGRSFW